MSQISDRISSSIPADPARVPAEEIPALARLSRTCAWLLCDASARMGLLGEAFSQGLKTPVQMQALADLAALLETGTGLVSDPDLLDQPTGLAMQILARVPDPETCTPRDLVLAASFIEIGAERIGKAHADLRLLQGELSTYRPQVLSCSINRLRKGLMKPLRLDDDPAPFARRPAGLTGALPAA